jgi:hypothetical protein
LSPWVHVPARLDVFKSAELQAALYDQCDAVEATAAAASVAGSTLRPAVFQRHYEQSSLVLRTGPVLRLWMAYAHPDLVPLGPLAVAGPERRAGKGKADDGAADTAAPAASPAAAASMALGKHLLDQAAYQTALSMFQHAQERALRGALRASLPAATTQQLATYYRTMVGALVHKVGKLYVAAVGMGVGQGRSAYAFMPGVGGGDA